MTLVSWPMNGWSRDVHQPIFPRGRGHGTRDSWQSHLAGPWPCHTTGFPARAVTKKGWWEGWSRPGPAASLGRARERGFRDLSFQRWHRVSWARGAGGGAEGWGWRSHPPSGQCFSNWVLQSPWVLKRYLRRCPWRRDRPVGRALRKNPLSLASPRAAWISLAPGTPPTTALRKQSSAAQRKSLRITRLGAWSLEGKTRTL